MYNEFENDKNTMNENASQDVPEREANHTAQSQEYTGEARQTEEQPGNRQYADPSGAAAQTGAPAGNGNFSGACASGSGSSYAGGHGNWQPSGGGQNSGQNPDPHPYGQEHKEHKKNKKGSTAARIAGITAAALLFGTVAGGTMVGVNALADYFNSNVSVQIGQTETVEAPEEVQEPQTQTQETVGQTETGNSAQAGNLLAMDVSGIVEKAMPSVVAINNTMLYESQTWFGPTQTYEVPSAGSGIIVGQNDDELLLVRHNHVEENSADLSVVFIDNESVPAAVKGTDVENDLAVIAVALDDIPADTMSQIAVATLGNSDDLKVGQGVIAIGNALGYGQSVTVGYVSALDREVKTEDNVVHNLLQTDAAINPGNSGGALLNMKGEVIGINSAKYSSTEVEGMGYAIPISKVQDIIDTLMTRKTRVEVEEDQRGYLGSMGRGIDEQMTQALGMPRGIYVVEILEDGAAANSDLHTKDIITKFDGQSILGMEDLQNMLTYYEAGTTVTLTVQSLDNGQYVERQVDITLGSQSETNDQ